MSQYKELLQHILDKGYTKADRTGVGTISTFGYQCRFDLKEGFPIVTEKRTAFKMAITELIWMIGGWMKQPEYQGYQRTNIKFLLDNNCKIWTKWPYKAYCETPLEDLFINQWSRQIGYALIGPYPTRHFTQEEFEQKIIDDKEFALKFGDLGPVYQKQWRDFEGKTQRVDQLEEMIDKLKNKPDDRRNLSSYWNPTELDQMLLPPCHMMHQVWTRELDLTHRLILADSNVIGDLDTIKLLEVIPENELIKKLDENNIPKRAISLQMYQRSSDCFLGVPFDWVWYGALTHILADMSNMVVDEFIWVSGDTHLYLNSIEETNQVLSLPTYQYPKFNIKRKVEKIEDYKIEDFELIDYKCGPTIKVAVAV